MAPKLIIIGGSLATGKSTLSKKIADALGIQRVSLDEIKEVLFDVGGYRDRAWSKEIGRLAFPVFRDLIELHLGRRESVVAEATFLWPTDREWLNAFSQTYETELVQIWLTSDPFIARERFIARASSTRHPGPTIHLKWSWMNLISGSLARRLSHFQSTVKQKSWTRQILSPWTTMKF